MKRVLLSIAATVALAISAGQSHAQAVSDCETVAGEAVAIAAIDADAALVACAAALAERPTDPQLVNAYARALEAAGRIEDARRLYGWAAEDGFAPARDALLRLDGVIADPGAADPAQAAAIADGMAALSAALRRYVATLPPDPGDPLPILAATGTDPAAIMAWVAANTRLVPYAGSLRGATGVLLDRAGNSLDRSLLLALLLRSAGEEVRLARTALDPGQVAKLVEATMVGDLVADVPPLSAAAIAAILADPRLPEEEVQAAAAEVAAAEERLAADLAAQTAAIVPVLLAAAGETASQADADARAAAVNALADHFWVQIRTGAGWRDVDPLGTLLGVLIPAETFAPDAVPEELRHAVILRAILEIEDADGRRDEPLLDWTFYPADGAWRTLSFSHLWPSMPTALQLAGTLAPEDRFLAALRTETAWMPVLDVDGDAILDMAFTRDGEIRPANVNAFAGAGRSLLDLFGDVGVLLAGEDIPVVEPAVPTAEWLEIEVRTPGEAPRIERRTIFDLLGPAARAAGGTFVPSAESDRARALGLLTTTDILIAGATLPDDFVARRGAEALAAIADQVRAAAGADAAAMANVQPTRLPLLLLELSARRLDGTDHVLTAPNVFLTHTRVALDGDVVVPLVEVDLVANRVGASSEPYASALRQGVVDTILEAGLLDAPPIANAAAQHAADLAAGRPWVPITAATIDRAAPAGSDYRARIEQDLAAGLIVVAPADPPADPGTGGWWRIDPRDGTTLGMLATGGGASLAEAAFLVLEGAATAICFMSVGAAMAQVLDGRVVAVGGLAACAIAGGVGAAGTGIGLGVGLSAGGFHIGWALSTML